MTPFRVGEHRADALAERFGTPLYVYDAAVVRRRYGAVRAAFGPDVEVGYSLKANPSAAVARVLRDEGAWAELASAGEIHVARAAGFDPATCQLSGPGKSALDRATAAAFGIGTVCAEVEEELVEPPAGWSPAWLLRAAPPRSGAGRPRLGHTGKFGFDEAGLRRALQRTRDVGLRVEGLHTNRGTQQFDAAAWAADAALLVDLADQLERDGARLDRLNFGGGFGVPTGAGEAPFDLTEAAGRLRARLGTSRPRRSQLELGRALVAEAGVYLVRVLAVKETHGERFAIVDGGMHHHAAAAGLGSIVRRPVPVVRCADPAADPGPPVQLGGPLCTSADTFVTDATLPALAPGDLLAVLGAGAYGLTFSPTGFLGHPSPAEVLVDGAHAWVVRDAGSPADALRGQRVP